MGKVSLVLAAAAISLCAADHPDLSGTWQLDAAHSKLKSGTLSITQKPDAVQIGQSIVDADGKESKIQIDCNTVGRQCEVQENGKPVQVSMWYNGPILVMLEQRGKNEVVRKRIKPSPDGKSLSLEIGYMNPPAPTETLTFSRQ